MPHTLVAGLMPNDNRVEFFACSDMKAHCITNGQTTRLDDFDAELMAVIKADMNEHKDKINGIVLGMGITANMAIINQYMVCNYGGCDHSPDLVDGKLQHKEYWACPKRGTCNQEGTVCDGLRTDNGQFLTPAEIRVLKLVALGYMDKEIAGLLNTAISTIPTHTRNIRRKTGLGRKADLTRFATLKNLI